ncbi:MAG: hypothetical protein ACP6IU_10135 [Candidatus Asgardarchaeia archaeon]
MCTFNTMVNYIHLYCGGMWSSIVMCSRSLADQPYVNGFGRTRREIRAGGRIAGIGR